MRITLLILFFYWSPIQIQTFHHSPQPSQRFLTKVSVSSGFIQYSLYRNLVDLMEMDVNVYIDRRNVVVKEPV